MTSETNVALYARVSKGKGQETDNQLDQLREFCRKRGWTMAAEYVDRKSGSTGERAQFKRMFAAASRREFDLLLFWSLDRLSREGTYETLTYLRRLDSYGVGWKSFTEQYLDSTGVFKDAVVSIMATLAKQERVRISERTIAGLERARRQGRIGGRPRRVFDRDKAKRMRKRGMTYREIGKALGVATMTARAAVMEG